MVQPSPHIHLNVYLNHQKYLYWHQEHRIGSIEFGKLANMTVFDCDFLHDDIEKVAKAKLIATLVDGGEVYKA